jgi:hypothetical protein
MQAAVLDGGLLAMCCENYFVFELVAHDDHPILKRLHHIIHTKHDGHLQRKSRSNLNHQSLIHPQFKSLVNRRNDPNFL